MLKAGHKVNPLDPVIADTLTMCLGHFGTQQEPFQPQLCEQHLVTHTAACTVAPADAPPANKEKFITA